MHNSHTPSTWKSSAPFCFFTFLPFASFAQRWEERSPVGFFRTFLLHGFLKGPLDRSNNDSFQFSRGFEVFCPFWCSAGDGVTFAAEFIPLFPSFVLWSFPSLQIFLISDVVASIDLSDEFILPLLRPGFRGCNFVSPSLACSLFFSAFSGWLSAILIWISSCCCSISLFFIRLDLYLIPWHPSCVTSYTPETVPGYIFLCSHQHGSRNTLGSEFSILARLWITSWFLWLLFFLRSWNSIN